MTILCDGDNGASRKYNRRVFFGDDGRFQHGSELLPCLGSLGQALSLRVVELDVPSQCSEEGYPVLELTTDRGTYNITNCCYEPADCGSWFFSVEMPWSSFGKSNDRGIVMCPRAPALAKVRPWTGVLESLGQFQCARRQHYRH